MNQYEKLKDVLELKYLPIGFKLIFDRDNDSALVEKFKTSSANQRFCNYIKEAAQGVNLKIKREDSSCFRDISCFPMPESRRIELDINLNIRGLKYLLLFPLKNKNITSLDGIILILNPKAATKIIEIYVEIFKKPLKLMCGIRTGVLSEIIAYVIKREDVNFSFLCSGARKYAEFDDCELICGIPGKLTDEIIKNLIME